VLEAARAEAALQMAQRYTGRIHLLLTDVVMPKVSGRALMEQMRQLRPELRVLYMSGYTDNVIAQHGVLEPGTPFIQKPFTPQALAQKVRAVLDG
jgi:DNA-binding NtrC family response regulator